GQIGVVLAPGGRGEVLGTSAPKTPARIAQLTADTRVHTVWFLRNTHDVSPEHWDRVYVFQFRGGFTESVTGYEKYTPLEHRAMTAMGIAGAPEYFSELLRFSR